MSETKSLLIIGFHTILQNFLTREIGMICREVNKVQKVNENDINSEVVLTIILPCGPQASPLLQSGGNVKENGNFKVELNMKINTAMRRASLLNFILVCL